MDIYGYNKDEKRKELNKLFNHYFPRWELTLYNRISYLGDISRYIIIFIYLFYICLIFLFIYLLYLNIINLTIFNMIYGH